ncbi:Hypothetical predicted protein [Pelobates cultripes]|uniref:Uncharacterized protein n=1 Tax=Pelobates cultripes TaxID=61616 RepID=A0AAD1RT91_PELCU|nr:Hypothetical predicted protein [Pelobates cultripes]
MAEAPGSTTRGLILPQPVSAGPKTKVMDTLGAIIDKFWAMLLNRSRQAIATREPGQEDSVRNKERPGRPLMGRQLPHTNPTTLKRRKPRKQHYRLRQRAADRYPAHRCRDVPNPNVLPPVLGYMEKPPRPPLSRSPGRPGQGISPPTERAAAWRGTTMLDSPVNPVGIG